MKNMITLLLLCAMVSLEGCDLFKNDQEPKTELEKLPPITQEGKNTFGCLVNGKALSVNLSTKMTAIYQGGFIQFGAGGVYIVVVDPFEINQSYDLTNIISSKAKYTLQKEDGTYCFYEFENTYEGFVDFSRIDKDNFIVSGTFEFSTVTTDCDTIKITNGRFDIQYIP